MRLPRVVRLAWWPAAAPVIVPQFIFVRRGVDLTVALISHELVHCQQAADMGLLRYWLTYLWLLVRFGYARHPMERAAEDLAHLYTTAAQDVIEATS